MRSPRLFAYALPLLILCSCKGTLSPLAPERSLEAEKAKRAPVLELVGEFGVGSLTSASGVAVDRNEVFVLDDWSTVKVFGANGRLVRSWGGFEASQIAADAGRVYLAAGRAVLAFDSQGHFLWRWDASSAAEVGGVGVYGVAAGRGFVYVEFSGIERGRYGPDGYSGYLDAQGNMTGIQDVVGGFISGAPSFGADGLIRHSVNSGHSGRDLYAFDPAGRRPGFSRRLTDVPGPIVGARNGFTYVHHYGENGPEILVLDQTGEDLAHLPPVDGGLAAASGHYLYATAGERILVYSTHGKGKPTDPSEPVELVAGR